MYSSFKLDNIQAGSQGREKKKSWEILMNELKSIITDQTQDQLANYDVVKMLIPSNNYILFITSFSK